MEGLAKQIEALRKEIEQLKVQPESTNSVRTVTHLDVHPYLRMLVQSLVAGALFVGAFFFLFQPIIDATKAITTEETKIAMLKAEQADLKAKVQEQQNLLLKQANEQQSASLKKENERIKNELQQLVLASKEIEADKERNAQLINELKTKSQEIQKSYENLSKSLSATQGERDKFQQLSQKSEERVADLENRLASAKIGQKTAMTRTKDLTNQLNTRDIRGVNLIIYYAKSEQKKAEQLYKTLVTKGMKGDKTEPGHGWGGEKTIVYRENYKDAALWLKLNVAELHDFEIKESYSATGIYINY